MAFRKRSFAEFAEGSENTLTITTAGGGRIPAHNEVLRLVCSCLKGSPASNTWDLSTLLVNGIPVQEETVTAVLQVVYNSIGALDFEMETTPGQYSLQQLQEMLLFADAVGCSKRIISQVASLLDICVKPELVAHLQPLDGNSNVTGSRSSNRESAAAGADADTIQGASSIGGTNCVCLQLSGTYTICMIDSIDNSDEYDLNRWQDNEVLVSRTLLKPQVQLLKQQLVTQLESLLLLAFKLDLQQLLVRVLGFLRRNVTNSDSLFGEAEVAAMVSARVAASASSSGGRKLLCWAAQRQCLGYGFGIGTLFGDHKFQAPTESNSKGDRIGFSATLLQNLNDYTAGTRVNVNFTVRGSMMINVQGSDVWAEYDYEVVLAPSRSRDEY